MIRWLRVVWPPWWTLIAAGLFYAVVEGTLLGAEFTLKQPPFSMHDKQTQRMVAALLGFYAFLYAAYRVGAFHPALRAGYYQWLCGTPWSSRHRLPLGPLHLVSQDMLLLAIAVAAAWPRLQLLALTVVAVFLFAYFLMLGVMHYGTGARHWAFAVGFGIGCMVLCLQDPLLFAIATAATYGTVYLGLRAALDRFPWDASFVQRMQLNTITGRNADGNGAGRRADVGWPFNRMGPACPDSRGPALRDTPLISALAGWWFFAITYQFRMFPDAVASAYLVYYGCLVMGVIMRVAAYCDGYLPPLSLMGRIANGRWIIPGYDQVFVAPLLAILVGLAAWIVPFATGFDPLVTTPIAFDLTLWILLGMGPSLQAWRLTGSHRIVAGLPSYR